jgi:hypothetical protein
VYYCLLHGFSYVNISGNSDVVIAALNPMVTETYYLLNLKIKLHFYLGGYLYLLKKRGNYYVIFSKCPFFSIH